VSIRIKRFIRAVRYVRYGHRHLFFDVLEGKR
jgi:hypothetical protein